MSAAIDVSRLTLLLNELRLPAIKHLWQQFAERSDKEGWPAARFLMALAEHEVAERDRRRIERHLGDAKLPADKILDNFDFTAIPMISKAQVPGSGRTLLAAGVPPRPLPDGMPMRTAAPPRWAGAPTHVGRNSMHSPVQLAVASKVGQ